MSCILRGRYNMEADILVQTVVNHEGGYSERTWSIDHTVECIVRPILSDGIRVVGSREDWGADYENIEWAKMRTTDTSLTKRMRVSNIRHKEGSIPDDVIWIEGDTIIEFEITGITPIIDPFSQVLEYDILLKGATGD